MPRRLLITEELTHATIRISTLLANGRNGAGTGFFFQFARDGERSIPAIVTNKHVFHDVEHAVIHFSVEGPDGDPIPEAKYQIKVEAPGRGLVLHPDPDTDLAALPFGELHRRLEAEGTKPYYRAFGFENVISDEELADLGAVEPILMVGYPIGLWDSVNNQPIIRQGVTATHPQLHFEGRPEFLIDCACWPGSSGSPVVLYNSIGFLTRSGSFNMTGPRIRLLGVLYAGHQFDAKGNIEVVNVPVTSRPIASTPVPINLGIVLKAESLRAIDRVIRDRMTTADT